jgi:hypothetical protein
MISITSKDFKTGKKNNTAPYWRFTANKSFMQKYFPNDPKIKKISVYIGGQGVLMDPRPIKDQPFFVFGKASYFTDRNLVDSILKHFAIPYKAAPEPTTIRLHAKPFGKFDEKILYELVYIDDENPDTTQLAGLKEKMEADENFPEPDADSKPQTITIEG